MSQKNHALKRVVIKPFDKDRFELCEDYTFTLPSAKDTILKGFKSNGADIPRVFWSLYPPNKSEYLSAVFIHDFLCEKAKSKEDFMRADKALKEVMIELDCGLKSHIFYLACRLYHFVKGVLWL